MAFFVQTFVLKLLAAVRTDARPDCWHGTVSKKRVATAGHWVELLLWRLHRTRKLVIDFQGRVCVPFGGSLCRHVALRGCSRSIL